MSARNMKSRGLAAYVIAFAISLAPLASGAQAPDPVFIDHGARGAAQGPFGTGTVFGSIGFAPPADSVSAMSLHLVPLEPGLHKIEIFAANRERHPNWRTPDLDDANLRVWAFAGNVPQGRYLMRVIGVSGPDPRDVMWIELSPSLELRVKAGAAVYIGRWQLTSPEVEVPEPRVRVPGKPLVLRDTLDADRAMLQKRGRTLPAEIDDAPKALFGPRV